MERRQGMKNELGIEDYPVAETRPDETAGARGKPLEALTLDAAVSGELTMEDLRITPRALVQQAQIARAAGRAALARNFDRAAEMARIPQDEVMHIYDLLRPGRAPSRTALEEVAERLEVEYEAPSLAAFVRDAAAQYDRRGLYRTRF